MNQTISYKGENFTSLGEKLNYILKEEYVIPTETIWGNVTTNVQRIIDRIFAKYLQQELLETYRFNIEDEYRDAYGRKHQADILFFQKVREFGANSGFIMQVINQHYTKEPTKESKATV